MLIIINLTDSDVGSLRRSAFFRAGTTVVRFYIYTREDRTLEYDESFKVVAYHPLLPSGLPNATTTVVIEDDDSKLLI